MSSKKLTYLGFLGYIFIGTAAVLIPSVMPFITEEFLAIGLTLATISLIFPAQSAGSILGNLLAGIGSDLMGRQRLVWLSALILAAALAAAAITKIWLLFLLGFVIISAAQGALSTGINAMIADANRDARGQALNTLHGIYGLGAAISPLIIGGLIERGLPWRWALAGTGLIWLFYSIVAYRLYRASRAIDDRADDEAGDRQVSQKLSWSLLGQGTFLALFIIAFAYNGVAYSLLGWIALYMQETAGFSTFFSISMISVFYVALTTGRFLCATFTERIGYARTLLILAVGITLTYPLVLSGANSMLVVIGVFLTGLSLSGLFPTALAYGARFYPEQTGTVTGTLNVAMTLGAMIPPLWTGVLADIWNFQVAWGINYGMVLPLIFIAIYLERMEKTSQPRTSPIEAEDDISAELNK